MDLLPADTPVKDIEQFLTIVIQERTLHRRRHQVLRSLLLAEHLQVMYCFVESLCHLIDY